MNKSLKSKIMISILELLMIIIVLLTNTNELFKINHS
jgi:hypothetical protein